MIDDNYDLFICIQVKVLECKHSIDELYAKTNQDWVNGHSHRAHLCVGLTEDRL